MDDYFEYLLNDPNYMGEEMFIMKHIGRKELTLNANQNAFKTYNKMNVSYHVEVEWGTGALGLWGVEFEMEMFPETIQFN